MLYKHGLNVVVVNLEPIQFYECIIYSLSFGLQGQFTKKPKFCHLLKLLSFQTWMTLFLT